MAKKINFKEAFEELEKITAEFEAGELDLDAGLKKFERGLELAKVCKERLKEVENKVIQLKEKFGALTKEPEYKDDTSLEDSVG